MENGATSPAPAAVPITYTSGRGTPPQGLYCLSRGTLFAWQPIEGNLDDDANGELAAEIEGEIEQGLAAIAARLHERFPGKGLTWTVET